MASPRGARAVRRLGARVPGLVLLARQARGWVSEPGTLREVSAEARLLLRDPRPRTSLADVEELVTAAERAHRLGLHRWAVALLHHPALVPRSPRPVVLARRRLAAGRPVHPTAVRRAFERLA
uniref:hypothetical protein n=1 Tax=Desertihabitans aurantiacus TaxID=2282477 RepID=UPI0018E59426